MQVDTRERGFSYAYDAPLDMRMDPAQDLSRRGRQHVGAPPARAHAARVRGGALRRADRARDRAPPRERPARHHLRARRRHHRRDPRAGAVRRRAPGQARSRRSGSRSTASSTSSTRRSRSRGAAAPDRPAGRNLVPFARGPARQAVPRRPRPGLHLPARPAGLRVRPHARGRAHRPPLRRPDARRGRPEPAREVAGCAPPASWRPPPDGRHRSRAPRRARPRTAPRVPGTGSRAVSPVPRSGRARSPAPRVGTGVFERIRALPDHRVIDRLLRGRVWICFVGVALMGIVAMQVSLLKLNSGISRAVETSATLERQNSAWRRASPASRPASASAPRPTSAAWSPRGRRRPLRARARGQDAQRALRRMRAPSEAAKELMGNHGVVPGSLMTPTCRRRRPKGLPRARRHRPRPPRRPRR